MSPLQPTQDERSARALVRAVQHLGTLVASSNQTDPLLTSVPTCLRSAQEAGALAAWTYAKGPAEMLAGVCLPEGSALQRVLLPLLVDLAQLAKAGGVAWDEVVRKAGEQL